MSFSKISLLVTRATANALWNQHLLIWSQEEPETNVLAGFTQAGTVRANRGVGAVLRTEILVLGDGDKLSLPHCHANTTSFEWETKPMCHHHPVNMDEHVTQVWPDHLFP